MSSPLTFDAYKALEVSQDASQQDIKSAYRRLALVHHPDKNREDPEATAKFQQINTAYETLSDSARKARYDAHSAYSSPKSSSCADCYCDSDSEDSFNFGRNNPFDFQFDSFAFRFPGGRIFFNTTRPQATRTGKEHGGFSGQQEYQQPHEKTRQARMAAARAKVEAEEAAAQEKKLAKEVKDKLMEAMKIDKTKRERAAQEKIWEKIGAVTTLEKQANCRHTGFWPKEQQKRKFKCNECGQKRGITAFKCPHCTLMICQFCVNKKN